MAKCKALTGSAVKGLSDRLHIVLAIIMLRHYLRYVCNTGELLYGEVTMKQTSDNYKWRAVARRRKRATIRWRVPHIRVVLRAGTAQRRTTTSTDCWWHGICRDLAVLIPSRLDWT